MSRSVNIAATPAHVRATSASLDAVISAIEPLHPSGTHVVFMNARDAARVAEAYGPLVLDGKLTRTPVRSAAAGAPWQPKTTA